jgi:hypothetical protein
MQTQIGVRDTFTLSGDPESRVAQLLRLAQHQARVAQSAAAPRTQDALSYLEDAITDQIVLLENAAEDDRADSEESGAVEHERRSYYPMRDA